MNKALYHRTDFYIADTSVELYLAEEGSIHIVREFSALTKPMNDLLHPKNPGKSWLRKKHKNTVVDRNPFIVVIPLTLQCRNRCDFKCSSNSMARLNAREISENEVKFIIDVLHDRYKSRIVIFTGGDPLLRKDIFRLIEYAAAKGMKTGIISNGMKCSDRNFTKNLSDSGLNSARINLESHDELVHNTITGNIESFKKTVSGIHNLASSGITTHTNTTICQWNRDHLPALAQYIHSEFRTGYISMSVRPVERIKNRDKKNSILCPVKLSDLKPVLQFCRKSSIKIILNSTSPECIYGIFNPETGSGNSLNDPNISGGEKSVTDEIIKLIKTKIIKKDIDKNEIIWKILY